MKYQCALHCCLLCLLLSSAVQADAPPKMQVVSDCMIGLVELAGLLSNCPSLAPRYYQGNFPPWFQYVGCVGGFFGTFFQTNICVVDIVNYFGIKTRASEPYRPTPSNPQDLLDSLSVLLEGKDTGPQLTVILRAALNLTQVKP